MAELTKAEIFSVIKKHLVNTVDGVDPDAIDPSLSMKDLGANSLDMVEVVSLSMRELRIKIPRSELTKLENMQGLVDLFYEVSQRSTAGRPA